MAGCHVARRQDASGSAPRVRSTPGDGPSDALNLATIRSEALEATLNALTFSVYLADRRGQIAFMNRAAEGQITLSTAIRVESNRFALVDPTARLALAKAIEEAVDDEVTDGL